MDSPSKSVQDGDSFIRLSDDIPLHLGWVCMLEGSHPEEAAGYFAEYVKKNEDRNYVFDQLMRVCRDVHDHMNRENLWVVTEFVKTQFLTLPGVKETLPVDGVPGLAHFQDLHAQAYLFKGDRDQAIREFETLFNEHFPKNLASINAAYNLANLYLVHRQDKEKCSFYANKVIQETDNADMIQKSQVLLKNMDKILEFGGR